MKVPIEKDKFTKFSKTVAEVRSRIKASKSITKKMISEQLHMDFCISIPDGIIIVTGINCSRIFVPFQTKKELTRALELCYRARSNSATVPNLPVLLKKSLVKSNACRLQAIANRNK